MCFYLSSFYGVFTDDNNIKNIYIDMFEIIKPLTYMNITLINSIEHKPSPPPPFSFIWALYDPTKVLRILLWLTCRGLLSLFLSISIGVSRCFLCWWTILFGRFFCVCWFLCFGGFFLLWCLLGGIFFSWGLLCLFCCRCLLTWSRSFRVFCLFGDRVSRLCFLRIILTYIFDMKSKSSVGTNILIPVISFVHHYLIDLCHY